MKKINKNNKGYVLIKRLLKKKNKKVSLIEKKENKQKVILKEINLADLNEREKNISLQEGIRIKQLNNTNIINCYKFFQNNNEKNKINFEIEYAEGGNLFNKIENHKNKNKYFKEEEIIDWFIEICEGVKYIQSKKLNDIDLKPQNIFLTKDNHIKIDNFCISKSLNNKNENIELINYLSPEIINHQPYDNNSVIWNLGIILYELTQLRHPFLNNKTNILLGKFNIINYNYSSKLLDLIRNLLKVKPKERKNIIEILFECYSIKKKKYIAFDNE